MFWNIETFSSYTMLICITGHYFRLEFRCICLSGRKSLIVEILEDFFTSKIICVKVLEDMRFQIKLHVGEMYIATKGFN